MMNKEGRDGLAGWLAGWLEESEEKEVSKTRSV
jgi:hypothetical protein